MDQSREASCLDTGLGELWDLWRWTACPQLSTRGAPRTLAARHQCLQGSVILEFAGLLEMLNSEKGMTPSLSFRQWICFHGCPVAERCPPLHAQAGWQAGG